MSNELLGANLGWGTRSAIGIISPLKRFLCSGLAVTKGKKRDIPSSLKHKSCSAQVGPWPLSGGHASMLPLQADIFHPCGPD